MPDKNILVVEDERPLSEAIRIKLEKTGFSVVTARSVDQALGHLQDGIIIHAIWLDHYLLGQGNGLDLVINLKGDNSPWKNIPIFVVSNTASPDKVCSYLHFGVNKYYTKADYRLDKIIGDIKSFLETGESKNC